MSLKLNSVGGGSVTLQEPNTASNFTLDLPAASGTVALTSSVVSSLNGQTGAITNTDLYAIGSYTHGRPANITVYAVNSTVAGSSLYAVSVGSYYNNSSAVWQQGIVGSPNQTLVNTGTWRNVSPTGVGGDNASCCLWVRIS
jgi:hypothetical protein